MYKILCGRNHTDLEQKINQKVDEGFVPTGGIAVLSGPMNAGYYFQAVYMPDMPNPFVDAPKDTVVAPKKK